LEEGLPEDDSPIAREGDLLHDYSAHPEYDRRMLKPNQKDLVDLADTLSAIVIDQVERDAGLGAEVKYVDYIEKQLPWNGIDFGRPDFTRFYPDTAIVIDRKFGYNVVDRADLNLQLRVYAVLAYRFAQAANHLLSKVYVAIVQPRAPFDERLTMALYLPDDIDQSETEIDSILKDANRLKAKLVAGDAQCQYCKAKLICPAFREAMMVPAVITPDKALSKTAREAFLEQRIAELNDEQLEKVILSCRLAKMAHDPAHDEARKRIAAGTFTNYTVAKDSEVRDIANVRKAMALLSLSGLDRSDIYECVGELHVTKLAEILRKRHANWTWIQANDWINKKLKSVIETTTRKGRLLNKRK
jgi:hypothetical protein